MNSFRVESDPLAQLSFESGAVPLPFEEFGDRTGCSGIYWSGSQYDYPHSSTSDSLLQEGLMTCAGKTLVELRQKVADRETKLLHLRAGAGMLSWGYFEKLVSLQNLEPDRSDAGTQSISDPVPIPSGELRVESLLDTLVWATNKFGCLSQMMIKTTEAANQISEASGTLNPKLESQQQSIVKMSEGLLALAAHIKVAGDAAAPVTATLKSMTKSLENTAWQLSGSGKVANCSVKDHLLSQGKLLGEASITATKTLEVLSSACEGILSINDTQKETNLLLKELVAGQKPWTGLVREEWLHRFINQRCPHNLRILWQAPAISQECLQHLGMLALVEEVVRCLGFLAQIFLSRHRLWCHQHLPVFLLLWVQVLWSVMHRQDSNA